MIRLFYILLLCLPILSDTKFYVLGTGTPNPNPDRAGSAYLLVVNDEPYLFDFGANVIRRAAKVSKTWGGENNFDVEDIKHAFLTHMHSDHTLGLSDLIITPWVMGRESKLSLYGPPKLKQMAENIIKAYEFDINYRITGTQPQNNTGYKINFEPIFDGYVYKDKNIHVLAFKNDHGDLDESYGFVITTNDKKILISGDTAPSQNLIKYGEDLDILVHEVYSSSGFKKKEPDWKIYHKGHHTSPQELAKIAALLEPKTLVLSHVLIWGATSDEIISDIAKSYDGNVIFPDDVTLIK